MTERKNDLAIALQNAMKDRGLTRYGAAQIIGADHDEALKTIDNRLARWSESDPKTWTDIVNTFQSLGYDVKIFSRSPIQNSVLGACQLTPEGDRLKVQCPDECISALCLELIGDLSQALNQRGFRTIEVGDFKFHWVESAGMFSPQAIAPKQTQGGN